MEDCFPFRTCWQQQKPKITLSRALFYRKYSIWYSFPHSIRAHTRSYTYISAVLKTASVDAILDATDKSFETKMAMVKVLQIAKARQISALASDLPASSAPAFLPALDLFMRRSPMNMVNAFEKKSAPTTCKAMARDPENLKVVIKVTDPAITLQQRDLTMLRTVVSEKVVGASVWTMYSAFLLCSCSKDSSYFMRRSRAFSRSFIKLASCRSTCLSSFSCGVSSSLPKKDLKAVVDAKTGLRRVGMLRHKVDVVAGEDEEGANDSTAAKVCSTRSRIREVDFMVDNRL